MTIKTVNCDGTVFPQTLFLGATIESFTSNVGWNGQIGTLSVQLREDLCDTTKLYYDGCGNTQTHTGPDFFGPPPVGSPVWFQYGSFTFGGILQSWKQRNDVEDGRSYTISVEDPTSLLEGVPIILGGYNGPTFNVPNLANVYGFMERFEQVIGGPCDVHPTLVTQMGYVSNTGFGGAQSNEEGMPWNLVFRGLNNLFNIPIGNLITDIYGGPRLKFKGHDYLLNLTELPFMPESFRVDGENQTIIDLIKSLGESSAFDFFIELVFVAGAGCTSTSGITGNINQTVEKHIIIRTVARGIQPFPAKEVDENFTLPIDNRLALGTISDFIGNGLNTSNNERGLELRTEPSNSMLTGEFRHDIWQQLAGGPGNGIDDEIWPFWGFNADGTPILGTGFGDSHTFVLNSIPWKVGFNTYSTNVGEIRAVMASEDMWKAYLLCFEPAKAFNLQITDTMRPYCDFIKSAFANNSLATGSGLPSDNINTNRDRAKAASILSDLCVNNEAPADYQSRIYQQLLSVASNYYGKQFLIKMPFFCSNLEISTDEVRYNYEMTDAAWADQLDIMGLDINGVGIEIFKTDQNLIKCIALFSNLENKDFSGSSTNFFTEGDSHWMECAVHQDVYFVPGDTVDARALIELEGPVLNRSCHTHGFPVHMSGASALFPNASADIANNIHSTFTMPGANSAFEKYGKSFFLPTAVAVPVKSKTLTYGPWVASNSSGVSIFGPEGKALYERDSRFNPWNFGGSFNMGLAALLQVNSKITDTQVIEQGSVSIAGAPEFSLGDVLLQFGPNLSNIDVTVGLGGIKTGYRFRTFTSKFGVLSKLFVDNISRTGKVQSNLRRQTNLAFLKKRQQNLSNFIPYLQFGQNFTMRSRSNTPHGLLVATLARESSQAVRTDIYSSETKQELGPLFKNWKDSAGMSMNGLMRPFQTGAKSTSLINNFDTFFSDGNPRHYPEDQIGRVINEDHIDITVNILNPFLNEGFGPFGGHSFGHDIEYIVRDNSFPVNLNVRGGQSDIYGSSYRGLGLRGPLVMVGWGFDTNNKPVPNENEANPTMRWRDNFLRRPDLWKAGPIDLRWDNDRKVWTSPVPHKIVRGTICDNCINSGSYGKVWLFTEDELQTDSNGFIATDTCNGVTRANMVIAKNETLKFLRKDWECHLMYDTKAHEWKIFSMQDHLFLCVAVDDISCPVCPMNPPPDNPREPTAGIPGLPNIAATPDSSFAGESEGCNAVAIAMSGTTPTFFSLPFPICVQNVLGQPICAGDLFISVAVSCSGNTEFHWPLQGQFSSATLVSSVTCDEDELVVCDTTIFFEGKGCPELCPPNPPEEPPLPEDPNEPGELVVYQGLKQGDVCYLNGQQGTLDAEGNCCITVPPLGVQCGPPDV